jgi:hypothetical protein
MLLIRQASVRPPKESIKDSPMIVFEIIGGIFVLLFLAAAINAPLSALVQQMG